MDIEKVIESWIKIKDKEPAIDQWCLIYVNGKVPAIANYKGNGKFFNMDLGIWDLDPDEVWMPCPLIPKDLQLPLTLPNK